MFEQIMLSGSDDPSKIPQLALADRADEVDLDELKEVYGIVDACQKDIEVCDERDDDESD